MCRWSGKSIVMRATSPKHTNIQYEMNRISHATSKVWIKHMYANNILVLLRSGLSLYTIFLYACVYERYVMCKYRSCPNNSITNLVPHDIINGILSL